MKKFIVKIPAFLATLFIAASLLVVGSAIPASASADGCTLAPGLSGAKQCIYVTGHKQKITKIESRYYSGVSPWPPQLCNVTHQTSYTSADNGIRLTLQGSNNACKPGLPGIYNSKSWSGTRYAALNTNVCARSKSSHTDYAWTSSACIRIKKPFLF